MAIQAAKKAIPWGARREYKLYWNERLQTLHDDLTAAREEAERTPSTENHIKLQETRAVYIRTKLEIIRSWRARTEKLNLEKDGHKLWKLVKQLNDKGDRERTSTLMTVATF